MSLSTLATLPRSAAPEAGASVTVLHELLDIAARVGPEYGEGLASHLPMALHALHVLGADEARLRQFLARSLTRFDPPPPDPVPRPLADWLASRGALAAHGALKAHFLADLATHGRDAVLRQSLPALVTGVGAAAFHGLIRSAHAVEAGHQGELASALAYWACAWKPLPRGDGGAAGRLDIDRWIEILKAAPTQPQPPGRLISQRIVQVVGTPSHAALAGRLQGSDRVLPRLAALSVASYRDSGNFTVLHLVTASRAMRVLSPWFDEPHEALASFGNACAAAWLASGLDPARAAGSAKTAQPLEWDRIIERAIASDDDHVIKLVHACVSENAHCPSPTYREAASRAVS